MSNEINLLYNQNQRQKTALTGRIRMLRFIAFGLLSLVSFFSIILFLLVVASPLPSLKKQEDQLILSLSQNNDVMVKQSLLIGRLKEIDTILKKRSDYPTLITVLEKGAPGDLSQIVFDKSTLTVTLSASNLDEITKYLDILRKYITNKQYFSNIYVSSIGSTQKDGEISGFTTELVMVLL